MNVDMTGPRLNAAIEDASVRKVVAMANESIEVHSNNWRDLQYFARRKAHEILSPRLGGQRPFYGTVGRVAYGVSVGLGIHIALDHNQ